MANNITIKDAAGATQTIKTTDNGGVHTHHHNIDSLPADPFGANADAAVVTDAAGSISGKLRGLIKWAFERMPASLGQKVKTASLPVVLASDQDALSVTDNGDSLTVDGTVMAGAGENHIGEVGGKIVVVAATPVLGPDVAYAAGDAIGTLLSFANAVRVSGGSGLIEAVVVADKAKQSAAMDLLLLDANPGGTTITDNAALTVADADLVKCVGVIPITAEDYHALVDNSVASIRNLGAAFQVASGTTLYGVLVARGTPTFAGASDVVVRLAISQN